IEVDDEVRSFGTSALDEVEDAGGGHRSVPSNASGSGEPEDKGRMRMHRAQLVETLVPSTRSTARILNQRPATSFDSALSAMDWREKPNRTSGNDGVPLQYCRLMESLQRPERPAPSLLQDVLAFPGWPE